MSVPRKSRLPQGAFPSSDKGVTRMELWGLLLCDICSVTSVNGYCGSCRLEKVVMMKSSTHTPRTSAISPKVIHSSSFNSNTRRPGVLKTQSSIAGKRISVMDGYSLVRTDFLQELSSANQCVCVIPMCSDISNHCQGLLPVLVN
jgi:hypothetical protein